MHIVDAIFERFGKAPFKALADETGLATQTIHSWKVGANIPAWRRPAVLEAARKLSVQLDAPMLAYLASDERAPKREDEAA